MRMIYNRLFARSFRIRPFLIQASSGYDTTVQPVELPGPASPAKGGIAMTIYHLPAGRQVHYRPFTVTPSKAKGHYSPPHSVRLLPASLCSQSQ
jgi:hypothetical protein